MGEVYMLNIALIGIVAVLMAILFKKGKEEYSLYISIAACIIILFLGIGKLETILDSIHRLQEYIVINNTYINILIKIIGITYITEFAAALCKDSGYSAIGSQVELIGKISVLAISMPILMALLDTINNFLMVQ
ncbi:MAG: stage III sporulation protein AD [Clostridiales bacterium]|nr:stage III sporulation protein AD [Clostridiales bacterium]